MHVQLAGIGVENGKNKWEELLNRSFALCPSTHQAARFKPKHPSLHFVLARLVVILVKNLLVEVNFGEVMKCTRISSTIVGWLFRVASVFHFLTFTIFSDDELDIFLLWLIGKFNFHNSHILFHFLAVAGKE